MAGNILVLVGTLGVVLELLLGATGRQNPPAYRYGMLTGVGVLLIGIGILVGAPGFLAV